MHNTHEWPLHALPENGFARLNSIVGEDEIAQIVASIEQVQNESENDTSPGIRNLLHRSKIIRAFANSPSIVSIVQTVLGNKAKAIKAIMFDKTPDSNWYVTWHQDLTIAVKKKIDIDGFGPWSIKDAIPHVQPSVDVMKGIVALRVHLDKCSQENGAIKFIPGSHDAGIIGLDEVATMKSSAVCCPAERGDIIVMRPLTLHSSSKSIKPEHRRVLHLEYAAEDLPGGLEWADG